MQASSSALTGIAHVYIDSRNAARTLTVGLYSDVSGHPGTLLSSGSISAVQSAAWDSVALTPVPLVSGDTYWLAVLGEQGTLRYRDREKGPCPSETSAQTNLGALSASWKTGQVYPTCPVSAYVTAVAPVFDPPTPVQPVPLETKPTEKPVGTKRVGTKPVETKPIETLLPAPTNLTLPTVAGNPTEGQVLSVTAGAWSGSPTSYAYQWQDCETSTSNCSNVSGATSSTYKLLSSDVGRTTRALITASNATGATAATSTGVGPIEALSPSANPPSASFTFTPSSPVTGQTVTLNGSSSVCPEGPCTYAWSDDGSPIQPVPALWPLGSGQTLAYTFSAVGTKYMRLIVTDATGQTATVEHNVVVEAVPVSPAPPSNTVAPGVSGTAQVGQMLTASNGSWSGSTPMTFGYQWQDCNTSGEACSNIAGATSASYTAAETDVGHTLSTVVTADNTSGEASASSVATATVEAPPVSPAPPSNTVAPGVSGTAQVGQTLTASNGSWSGSTPMTFGYQWQDCNTSGEACSNIAGATSAAHAVAESDIARTLRVLVTATNGAGSTTSSSIATATVAAGSSKCTVTDTASMSASTIANSIVSVADGGIVCLAGGSYPFIHVVGAAHKAYATVRPVAGATATVEGMEVANSSFLRFEGLRMTEGFNMRDSSTGAGHDYQFIENTFESPLYGIVLFGGSGPIKKVLIEGNYMHYVHLDNPEVNGKCSAGYAQGQDVTIDNAEGVTISHNTFNEAAWHYIQGGGDGPEGVDVEHNLFEGKILMACSHLNLWQIWAGGENDTFKSNVAMGQGRGMKNGLSEEAATDGVIFENGAGSVECGTTMKNSVIENNLFVNAATSYELQIYTTEGATIKNNTVVGSEWGSALLTEHCGAGSNYTMTHNIDVEDQGSGGDMSFGACSGTCLFDYNASEDTSANQAGSTHYTTKWSPKWTTTAWNPAIEATMPAGFYVPTGLSTEAGYKGTVGP